MTLTLQQRIDRIGVRLDELVWWREREAVPVAGWMLDGASIEIGGFWPKSRGTVAFAAQGRAPEHYLGSASEPAVVNWAKWPRGCTNALPARPGA